MPLVKVNVFCGCRLYSARLINDMSLEDLSNETGITLLRLIHIEKGIELPTKIEENKIAKVLKVKPPFFYFVDTSPLRECDCTFSPRMKRM